MKKITSLIVSGMLMLSMVGCGNTNQFENTTVQEQQIENPVTSASFHAGHGTFLRQCSRLEATATKEGS